jgi:hypothetical protein
MKLVVLTFAGRESSMKILFQLILKYKRYIHEYRLYVATLIQSDIDYIEKFASENDFIKVVYTIINNVKITNTLAIFDSVPLPPSEERLSEFGPVSVKPGAGAVITTPLPPI